MKGIRQDDIREAERMGNQFIAKVRRNRTLNLPPMPESDGSKIARAMLDEADHQRDMEEVQEIIGRRQLERELDEQAVAMGDLADERLRQRDIWRGVAIAGWAVALLAVWWGW